jgi:hypothetical protein
VTPKVEEAESVDVVTRDFLGDGGERCVPLAIELEALVVLKNDHADRPAFELPDDRGPRRWQARIAGLGRAERPRGRDGLAALGRADHRFRGHHADLGVVGQFGGPLPCPLGEVALGVGLNTPGDLSDQVRPVPRSARVAVELRVAFHQFTRRHLVQGCELSLHRVGHGTSSVHRPGALTPGPRGHTEALISRQFKSAAARFAVDVDVGQDARSVGTNGPDEALGENARDLVLTFCGRHRLGVAG